MSRFAGILRNMFVSLRLRSSMLHGSETWPVRKEKVVALQRAEMRMVRWMCGVKLKDRLPSKELRERLGVDDIAENLGRVKKIFLTLWKRGDTTNIC